MGTLILIDDDVPVEVEFIETTEADTDDNSNASLSANWGDEVDGRLTIVAVHHAGGSLETLDTAMIGGVEAFELAPQEGQGTLGVVIIGALNVPGTSGTIDLTFSGGVGVRCAVWRAVNVTSITPIATDGTDWPLVAGSQTVNLNVEADGAVFAAVFCAHNDPGPDFTAGVDEDYSEEIVPTSAFKIMGGFGLTPSTVNLAVTAARTAGATWRGAMTAFSIR